MGDHRVVERCRICASSRLRRVLDLGSMPLPNAFLRPADLAAPEPRYRLEMVLCESCGLAQLSIVVRPDVLFRNYLYASSASAPMRLHFAALADELLARFAPAGSLVVEIGSNDGVLLAPLRERGARILGVEPATNLARTANEQGLETWNEFFSPDVARRIVASKGRAAVVAANNVLAHIDDLGEFLAGLEALLAPDGVFVAEVPYLGELVQRVEYDTVYHEHLSYFAITPLIRLFSPADMELFDLRRLPVHGGSIRIYVSRRGRMGPGPELQAARDAEARLALDDIATYEGFAARVAESRDRLRAILHELRAAGRRVVGLGASAKGNVLLNYCGLGPDEVHYVADSTPLKHGLLTPGTHIPIRPESAIREERPDVILLLAWNYADTIVPRFADFIASGGRFIHPVPLPRFIPA